MSIKILTDVIRISVFLNWTDRTYSRSVFVILLEMFDQTLSVKILKWTARTLKSDSIHSRYYLLWFNSQLFLDFFAMIIEQFALLLMKLQITSNYHLKTSFTFYFKIIVVCLFTKDVSIQSFSTHWAFLLHLLTNYQTVITINRQTFVFIHIWWYDFFANDTTLCCLHF